MTLTHEGNPHWRDKDIYSVSAYVTIYVEASDKEDAMDAADRIIGDISGEFKLDDVVLYNRSA